MFKEVINMGLNTGLKSGSKLIEEQGTTMVRSFMFTAKLYIALGVIISVLVIGCLATLIVKLV